MPRGPDKKPRAKRGKNHRSYHIRLPQEVIDFYGSSTAMRAALEKYMQESE